jgi:hypothetical protein
VTFDFNVAKPLFGSYKQHQVDGINALVKYGDATFVSRLHLAYILATAWQETGKWMQPIREGALRYGPAYTDAQSRRAVASIFAKGIIRTNYALPTGPFQQSYYGRGLVQITWYDNYLKFEKELDIPLTRIPDLALDWNYANPILFTGMLKGMFTGKGLDKITAQSQYTQARAIVNGDVKKNGAAIANAADVFYAALRGYDEVPVTATPTQEEPIGSDRSGWSRFKPAWWPF